MIYLDLGCHNGQSVIDFFNGKFGSINPSGAFCFAFDPLNTYLDEWRKITKDYNVLFINKAVSDHNGIVKFSKRSDDVKSSIMPEKNCFNDGIMMEVECLDISNLVNNLHDIVMRMDIEGAEYLVLDKLIKTGAIKNIVYLEVEWHAHKFNEDKKLIFEQKQEEIETQLKSLGINYISI